MKRITQIVIVGVLLVLPLTTSAQTGSQYNVEVNDSTLLISKGDAPILHYRHAILPAPAGQPDKFARSGFIHPLYSPSGEVLTWAQPPDHLHHMGIWNPWTRATWIMDDGTSVLTDFWNLAAEEGTVRFKEIVRISSTGNSAEIHVKQDHIAFDPPRESKDQRKEIVVMQEDLIIRIHPHPKGYLMDFESYIINNTTHPISLDAYRYGGGIGYRATGEFNNTNSEVLTSEGKTWKDGDATRAYWCRVSGDLKGLNTGLLFMSHSSNYDSPQQMRIWPDNSNVVGHQYFEFTPIREKAWVLQTDKTYSQKYQILVFEGQVEANEADELWKKYDQPLCGTPKVLIYTKNGEGFVHDNIDASVSMLKILCDKNGITYDVSDDPAIFIEENLKKYDALIFTNTNNDAFATNEQRLAFKRFIEAGGGFVGIHSACGSERNWPWFWKMLGGSFVNHPPYQEFDVKVIDPNHPSTAHFMSTWKWEDEAYYLHQLNPGIHVLLSHDLTTIEDKTKAEYPGTIFGDFYPGAWCQEFDGGVQWYTTYGHSIKHYSDLNYMQHIEGGIIWTLERVNKDYGKAKSKAVTLID